MIGSRILVAAVTAALVVGLGGGAPRPEVARSANTAIADAGDRTLTAIDRLETQLAPALDAARAGASRVVVGDEDPAEPLTVAAEAALDATPAVLEVRRALADLERARAALDPDAEPLPVAPGGGELASIAAQLDDTAEVAAQFAET
jgi:hypothetical protein